MHKEVQVSFSSFWLISVTSLRKREVDIIICYQTREDIRSLDGQIKFKCISENT